MVEVTLGAVSATDCAGRCVVAIDLNSTNVTIKCARIVVDDAGSARENYDLATASLRRFARDLIVALR
jgi:hypothetical protein